MCSTHWHQAAARWPGSVQSVACNGVSRAAPAAARPGPACVRITEMAGAAPRPAAGGIFGNAGWLNSGAGPVCAELAHVYRAVMRRRAGITVFDGKIARRGIGMASCHDHITVLVIYIPAASAARHGLPYMCSGLRELAMRICIPAPAQVPCSHGAVSPQVIVSSLSK